MKTIKIIFSIANLLSLHAHGMNETRPLLNNTNTTLGNLEEGGGSPCTRENLWEQMAQYYRDGGSAGVPEHLIDYAVRNVISPTPFKLHKKTKHRTCGQWFLAKPIEAPDLQDVSLKLQGMPLHLPDELRERIRVDWWQKAHEYQVSYDPAIKGSIAGDKCRALLLGGVFSLPFIVLVLSTIPTITHCSEQSSVGSMGGRS